MKIGRIVTHGLVVFLGVAISLYVINRVATIKNFIYGTTATG